MSWLFSQALAEEYLEDICSDGEQYAPLSGPLIQQAYCSPDKMTEFSRLSRFGMTFKPLTADRGEELLTLYLADSRVRTSAPQGGGLASKDLAAECGNTWPALSARFDPATYSWKTAHCLWEEGLQWSSVTLPRWGMTHSGFVYQHPIAERPISGTESGLWRTPNAHVIAAKSTVVKLTGRKPTDPQVGLADQVMAAEKGMWPTPTVNGNYNRKGVSKNSGDGLATAVRQRPTPVATMSKGSSPASLTRKSGKDRSNDRLDHAVMASDGGQLNPTWVEWLMGWPLGWTDLKPLEMGRFLEWQQQHSICCSEESNECA